MTFQAAMEIPAGCNKDCIDDQFDRRRVVGLNGAERERHAGNKPMPGLPAAIINGDASDSPGWRMPGVAPLARICTEYE